MTDKKEDDGLDTYVKKGGKEIRLNRTSDTKAKAKELGWKKKGSK